MANEKNYLCQNYLSHIIYAFCFSNATFIDEFVWNHGYKVGIYLLNTNKKMFFQYTVCDLYDTFPY